MEVYQLKYEIRFEDSLDSNPVWVIQSQQIGIGSYICMKIVQGPS